MQLRVGTNLERTGVQLWHPFQVATHNAIPASRDPMPLSSTSTHRHMDVGTHTEKQNKRTDLTKYSKNTEKDPRIEIFGKQWV